MAGLWLSSFAGAAPAKGIRIVSPCVDGEKWQFEAGTLRDLPPSAREHIPLFLNRKEPPYHGFAEGWALKKKAKSEELTAFGQYWMGRALYAAGLNTLAAQEFDALVSQPPTQEKLWVQLAAMTCRQWIHKKYPAIHFSPQAFANLPAFFKLQLPDSSKTVLGISATQLVLTQIKEGASEASIRKSLALLKGMGPLEEFALGYWAAQKGQLRDTVTHLEKVFAAEKLPPSIKTRRNEIRMVLAEAYYQTGKSLDAIRHWELIDKDSNELVPALIHLASAQLLVDNYAKSIGAAVSLQTGGLGQTFTPGALITTAMALNELCQFPDALRILKKFKRDYQSSFAWLKDHVNGGKRANEPLYPLVLAFLKKQASGVPDRVASEWTRSPIFLANQERLNMVLRTLTSLPERLTQATALSQAEGKELIKRRREIAKHVEETKKDLKPGQPLPKKVTAEIAGFRAAAFHQANLTQALSDWKSALDRYASAAPRARTELTDQIEGELKKISARMWQQINMSVENADLIEAEMWNGASADIVWQNAHPDYKDLVKKGMLDSGRKPASRADIYDWGNFQEGTGEIWEDELGNIQASLENNCENKERYMQLQRENK